MSTILTTSGSRSSRSARNLFLRRTMGCPPGAPALGPSGGIELEEVGRLTGMFPGSPGGIPSVPGDDSRFAGYCCRGSFEIHHIHLGGCHILATVAHNVEIIGLPWWLVVNCCVSCWMENGHKTAEHLEMAAVNVGNHTLAADHTDWGVSQIDCICQRLCEPLSADPELWSLCCCKANRQPSGAIFAVFSGNTFVDILCWPR